LITVERDPKTNSKEVDALGPFITSKKNDVRSEYGFRPFFYVVNDKERDSSEFDFIYPIATYDRRGDDWRFQFLVYLLYYDKKKSQGGFVEREFNLFPFIFTKKAENKDDSYFALFPLFGNLKNKFYKDEINFVLFPLFLETRNGEEIHQSFLWPFFGYYKGGGQKGFRFWPLFGYRKKGKTLDEKFALWPIFIDRRKVFYGEERRTFSIFPLYTSFETPDFTNKTYLWPFFNFLEDKRKGIKKMDTPWPFIGFTRGERRGNRFFPFFSSNIGSRGGGRVIPFNVQAEQEEPDKDGFILWPLYRYSKVTLEDYKRTRKSVLLVLYKDIKDQPIIEGGTSGRRVSLWPLFSYTRDRNGNRNFKFISLLEPLISGSERLERNWSPLWQFFVWKKYNDGRTVTSFLWNIFRTEHSEEVTKVSFQPIIPIFSYTKDANVSKTHFLGGLFGYQKIGSKKKIKLFFIPINISSKNNHND